ncbi:MAG TPA: nucleotide exchange factor GrpE, partial [Bacteroidetes bacterium]|nr:nucleotide exchange factor GrpE [Bacteroidota bacterium]
TDLHEAVAQVQAPNEESKGKIIDVVEKGYILNEKVLRFAKVVVAN